MTTELLTKRLLLRRFRESDWRALHAILADEKVTRYIPAGASGGEETREWVRFLVHAHRAQPPRYDFAVELRPPGGGSEGADSAESGLIGSCWLTARHDESRQGELGYIFAHSHWGRGYATEAARAVLRYGFTELDLHRIYATCRPANIASWRVMEKLGMRREGHLVEHRWMKERWQDSYLYAILDHEWRALDREQQE